MFKSLMIATAFTTTLFAGGAFAGGHEPKAPIQMAATESGKVYTDANGMTLYTFDKDTKGMSNCNDGCAVKWPPLMADAKAVGKDPFSIITRADGSKQWAVNGMPLYTWIKDKKPGDVTGDGVKGVWHVAKP
ncbi:COG4315 family predicted lipoprotein [Profundibacter sp.]